ncbi:MAG: dipeptidase [Acidobacteriota bacterium]|nr:dipeptidase [Acidobacteriota bacterium]
MISTRIASTGIVALLVTLATSASADDLKVRADRLHRSAIVVDTHEDVPERLGLEWVDISVRNKTGHVDIPRLKEGGVTGAFFAAYVPASFAAAGGAAKKTLELIDLIRRLAERHPELVFADSPDGVRAAKRAGKIAVLVGIEGGHAIDDSLGALSSFARLGVRYMTLTHTNTNNWADSSGNFFAWNFDPKKVAVHDGLSPFGREVVLEMNRLGMLVDVSHVSDKTIADVLATSKAPVFASHSSCRALSGIPRNLTDDQIQAIAAKGGVVMVNVSSTFLDQAVVDDFVRQKTALAPKFSEVAARLANDPGKRDAEIAALIEKLPRRRTDWKAAVDHIERILKIAGPGSVGLGTDFDGIPDPPNGLEDVSKLPRLTEELLRRGHSEKEVRGVLGENFLQFWERARGAAAKAGTGKLPLPPGP